MPLVGVAIAIPEPYGTELRAARARFGDPLASAIPTHVTLLPPTEIDAGELAKVDLYLEDIAGSHSSFEMRLQGTSSFRPISPVVFVQVVRGSAECRDIEVAVRAGPLTRDLVFPYHPHVTIAHDLPAAVLEKAAAELATYHAGFEVTGFSRYHHGADGVWRPDRDYPFAQDGRASSGSH